MPMDCLRATLVLTLCTISPLAWAGGGGGTGTSGTDSGGTDSGATDSGGTDSSATDSGGTTGEGSSSSGECGECTPSPDPVQVVSPTDGAVVPRTFDVRITAPHTCSCDDMCCATFSPASLTLRIDSMTTAVCTEDECDTTDHTFTVENVAPGMHTLDALAPVGGSPEFSAQVMITVEGEVLTGGDTTAGSDGNVSAGMTAGMGTGSSGGSSSGTTAGSGSGGDGGCGCRSQPGPGGLAPLGLGLVLIAARRRRS